MDSVPRKPKERCKSGFGIWQNLINVQACMKENNEKKMENCDEISKLIKAFPKDIAALDKRSVLAKVNSQGSGRQKPVHDFKHRYENMSKGSNFQDFIV